MTRGNEPFDVEEHRPSLRRQYSFWPGANGVDAWDVDRLIALSADLPVEEVSIATIGAIDTDDWFGAQEGEPTVRGVVEQTRRIDGVDLSFPIILGADGRVMDGMHRVAKAILEGRETIRAVRFSGWRPMKWCKSRRGSTT